MKRIFCLYLLWVLCLTAPMLGRAVPWGVLEEAVNGRSYGVDKLLANETIYYTVSADITPQEEKSFVNGFHMWTKGTLRAIEQVGRADEFKDIVPILQRGVRVVKTDSAHADITLFVDVNHKFCGENANGCFQPDTNKIAIAGNHRDGFAPTITHEIGHYYGLGDQYNGARNNSSSIYASGKNYAEGSLMQGSYTTNGKLTCDDYDGFINLIDLRTSQNTGKFSARARNGWWSLCKKTKNFYQEAKTTNREYGLDHVDLADERNFQFTEYDKKGNLVGTSHSTFLDENSMPLFALSKDDTVTRDNAGRITRIVSAKGSALCPVSKKSQTSVRTFEYAQTDRISYEIRIKCAGAAYTVPVIKSADWDLFVPVDPSGKGRMFYREFPVQENGYTVAINFTKNRISKIDAAAGGFVSTARGSEHRRVYLAHVPSDSGYTAELEGYQQLGYRLTEQDFRQRLADKNILPSHRAMLLEAKDAYNQVAPYVSGFYNNFYKPVLGLSAAQQARQQVKKVLTRN